MNRHFYLTPEPPFRLDLTVWALRRRPRNAIDYWHDGRYSRSLYLGETYVDLSVRQIGPVGRPKLEVFYASHGHGTAPERISYLVEHLLGLTVSMAAFHKLATTDHRLDTLVKQFEGFHPPRFPTVFEAAVNAVCCQQLSIEVGVELSNRLASAAARPFSQGTTGQHAFPRPSEVASLSQECLRELGFSARKVATLRRLAGVAAGNNSCFEKFSEQNDNVVRARLLGIKGIGRWSTEYILLRGMGRLNVFPADDVAAQKSLRRWFGIGSCGVPSTYDDIQNALLKWFPFQGLVYFYLLLGNLQERGLLESGAGFVPPEVEE